MRLIAKQIYRCTIQKYSYLPKNMANLISKDQQSIIPKYNNCLNFIKQINSTFSSQQAKLKYNMLYSIICANDTLNDLKPILYDMIKKQQLKTQYEIDAIIKWLIKEIKVNKSICQADIRNKLSKKEEQITLFQQQLQKSNSFACHSDACKYFRDKFLTIDSKLIYQKVKNVFKSQKKYIQEDNIQRKRSVNDQNRVQNKIWDKLLDIKPRRIKQQCNTKQGYQQHLLITGNIPRFRFPPQPNGYLHIGHVKSIRTNFQSAKRLGGVCYLRYDDTNPDKQSIEFIKEIEDNVKWLGYTPDKITFASDYFEQLLQYAHILIKKGHAYVCDSSKQEIELQRKEKRPNPYRNRKIQQSLKIFPTLQNNQTLRFKGTPDSPNSTLRDPIIYRSKSKPHPRTGHKYKIYPIYDFTHCISDSLEHIDYSLCSLEFQVRRQLYYKFLDILQLYKPTVWEYSRLNIQSNILSKRKIKQLIQNGSVDGWDDPRLLTIRGLMNRGYSPQMLIKFIDKINCSRSGNQNQIQYSLLQRQMKKQLYKSPNKAIGILQPLKIKIDDTNTKIIIDTERKLVESSIFIQKEDFQLLKKEDFVILKYGGLFKVQNKQNNSLVMSRYNLQTTTITDFRKDNPQTKIINWINQSQSQQFKIVMYDKLLNSDDTFNQKSKIVYNCARIPTKLIQQRPQYILLQRNGFFKFSEDYKELRLCVSV